MGPHLWRSISNLAVDNSSGGRYQIWSRKTPRPVAEENLTLSSQTKVDTGGNEKRQIFANFKTKQRQAKQARKTKTSREEKGCVLSWVAVSCKNTGACCDALYVQCGKRGRLTENSSSPSVVTFRRGSSWISRLRRGGRKNSIVHTWTQTISQQHHVVRKINPALWDRKN